MRKVVIFAVLCLLLFIVPSLTVGIKIKQESETESFFNEWTFMQGIITRLRRVKINGGRFVEFNIIFVHYRTHWYGNVRAGFFHRFERIIFPEFHYGLLTPHLILARFNMALFT